MTHDIDNMLDSVTGIIAYYILDDNRAPIRVSRSDWIDWWTEENKRVGWTVIYKGCVVSTMFLGTDYRLDGLLFETMVFGGPLDTEEYRYATWQEAQSGHSAIVEKILADDSVVRKVMQEQGLLP